MTVFERSSSAGGKLAELRLGSYRFDKGPSLFTLPHLVKELQQLTKFPKELEVIRLNNINNYFFSDGTVVRAGANPHEFARELSEKLGENKDAVDKYLNKSKFYYESTFDLFLNQSLGRWRNFVNWKTLKGVLRSPRLGLMSSMHEQNKQFFKNAKTVQIFDRYATYNGSDPYKAPALLNQIQHLEFGDGAYLPAKGMRAIADYLYEMAIYTGASFRFNTTIERIELEGGRVKGVVANKTLHEADLVLCNTDIHLAYSKLLPKVYYPHKLLSQEKSSSACVFYWAVKKTFPELGVHNILFSSDYQQEFNHLFGKEKPFDDPTVYINITSKLVPTDAPEGAENWFVMVNVPHNASGRKPDYIDQLREQVVAKINSVLKTDITSWIEQESTWDPHGIEQDTSSFGGSLYGNSSNNKFSAFLRHHNFHSSVKGLYFAGGSVHPGGGIPLCLLSGKISSDLIIKDHA